MTPGQTLWAKTRKLLSVFRPLPIYVVCVAYHVLPRKKHATNLVSLRVLVTESALAQDCLRARTFACDFIARHLTSSFWIFLLIHDFAGDVASV